MGRLLTLMFPFKAEFTSLSYSRSGMEANQLLRAELSSTATNALQDVDVANKGLISSIDGLLKLDHDAHGNIDSLIIPCRGELRELRSGHHHETLEITENAEKCLEEEYLVDEPSCSTPRRRVINLPSVKSIEELRAPAFEELLKSFWEAKSDSKQVNGDNIKHFSGAHEFQSQTPRLPLTTIN
ncbi:putative Kinesin-like protein KIN-5A [Cocos nucifera]|nr:putative Kinesin-like protein KIN-5A [Cocos nucifera]